MQCMTFCIIKTHKREREREMEMVEEEVVIVGGGIAGLATALALKRVGIRALVLERSHDLRTTGAAITLYPNAWLALDALGVSHKLTSIYPPFKKGYVTNVSTGATQELSFTDTYMNGDGPRAIHRKALLGALAEELPIDSIRFSSKLTSIETTIQEGSSNFAIIHLEDGTVIKAKVLIGCDGVHSVVARWLGFKTPVNSGRWAVRGLAVYPQGHGFSHEVRQFVDVGKRAGVVPLTDKEVFWGLSCELTDKAKEIAGDPKLIQKSVLEDFAKDFPPSYIDVVRHSDLTTLSGASLMFRYPWDLLLGNANKLNITLAGDAMHPMTPDLGQGGGAALEDAVVLGRHIGDTFIEHGRRLVPDEVVRALEKYVKERRWRAAKLITGSYLSGWAQQSGAGWFMKFIRDVVFYRLLYKRFHNVTQYDCGKLPIVPSYVSNNHDVDNNKFD